MKRLMTAVFALSLVSIGFIGCAEKTSITTETKKTTPGGTTTTTTDHVVKTTGDNTPTEKK